MRCYFKLCLLSVILSLVNPMSVTADEIVLQNGDRITGKVIRLEGEKLFFETTYAGELTVKWGEVAGLKTDAPVLVVLSDETALKGTPEPAEGGKLSMKIGKIVETVSFDLAEVKAINPKEEPAVKMKGRINIGISAAKGNTETETQHLDGQFVARTAKNRYTVGGEYNRAENKGEKTADSALGYIKYDHFLSQKWFLYSNALFEKDKFKDLNLRATLGAGAGYQFFESDLTNLSLEAGLSYVSVDYEVGEDDDYPAGRWALDYDRYFFGTAFQFFHFHEGFVGLEDTSKFFVRTRTGLRVPLYRQFNATLQYNYDWDNSPAPGREKTDEMYLFTLGYHWE